MVICGGEVHRPASTNMASRVHFPCQPFWWVWWGCKVLRFKHTTSLNHILNYFLNIHVFLDIYSFIFRLSLFVFILCHNLTIADTHAHKSFPTNKAVGRTCKTNVPDWDTEHYSGLESQEVLFSVFSFTHTKLYTVAILQKSSSHNLTRCTLTRVQQNSHHIDQNITSWSIKQNTELVWGICFLVPTCVDYIHSAMSNQIV